MKFQRSIGFFGFLFCIISAIVGSGWLLGPFFIAKAAGPAGIISWGIGGIVMIVVLLSYAELSALLPLAGGPIRYLQFSHGTAASFTLAWITWLGTVATAPVETLAMLHYAANYIPFVMYTESGVALLTFSGYVIAAALLLLMTLLNALGAKLLSKSNNFVMIFKLLAPLLTLGFLFSVDFNPDNFHSQGFSPLGWKGILSAVSTAGVVFSLMGCHAALQFSAEIKNPKKIIPVAIICAIFICVALYTLLQTAFIGAIDPNSLKDGWAALSFEGDTGPFVGLAMALGAFWLTKILYLDAIISPAGCGLVYVGASARLGYAMAKSGFLPKQFMKLNRAGVPLRMMALNYLIGLFLFLPFPTWQSMMSFLVSSLILGYAVGPLTLNILRKNVGEKRDSFRVPFPLVTGYLGFYFSNMIALWTDWSVISKTMIAILIGSLVLFWYKFKKSEEPFRLHFKQAVWLFPYLVGLTALSYLSSFGGINLIPFGWDFLITAIFSLVIFVYAQKIGLDKKEYSALIDLELNEAL
jgi:amino acid transporter